MVVPLVQWHRDLHAILCIDGVVPNRVKSIKVLASNDLPHLLVCIPLLEHLTLSTWIVVECNYVICRTPFVPDDASVADPLFVVLPDFVFILPPGDVPVQPVSPPVGDLHLDLLLVLDPLLFFYPREIRGVKPLALGVSMAVQVTLGVD